MKPPEIIASLALAAMLIGGTAHAAGGLKDIFKDEFKVGAALNEAQFSGNSSAEVSLILKEFNTITPENVLKWERVHPSDGQYNFGPSDRYVEFGQKHGMFIVGHTLVWHSQTPAWAFEDGKGGQATREQLLARMSNHIHQVVGRYKGRVKGWDVVNEALNDNGTMRETPWRRIIGADYIRKAFEFAHQADPQAELYYNEYSLEGEAKRTAAIRLVKELQSSGVKINGIGTQMHVRMDHPKIQDIDETLAAFGKLGIKVMVTELDVDVLPRRGGNGGADVSLRLQADPALNPYTNGLPENVQQQLAKRYAELFNVFRKYSDVIDRVTFWGVTDRDSWLNNWPIRGRTAYPLLFDRSAQPKPAYHAVVDGLKKAQP